MDHNGRGEGSREAGRAGVVILSAACCNPSMGGMDDQAGALRLPVVMINGKAVSYAVPDARRITAALRELAGAEPAVKLNSVTGQMNETFGYDMVSTPCAEEMATFDQFVTFLEESDADVIVFDTAPTGKKMAELMRMDEDSFANLEKDRLRCEHALSVLRDRATTVFSLVLIPVKLPIEETHSAITGLARPVHAS